MIQISEFTRMFPVEMKITGKKRKIGLKFFDLLFKFRPDKTYVITKPGIEIDPRQPNERLLYYFYYNLIRHYENSPLGKLMKKMLAPGDLFLDIGANLGMYSAYAKYLGANVFSFEPEPNHNKFLERNNHFYDELYSYALTDKKSKSEFYVAADFNPGSHSLVLGDSSFGASGYSSVIKVDTERLDSLLQEQDYDKIKLMKIDVEGNEEFVIRGAEKILINSKLSIWCEVRGDQSGRNPGSYRRVIDFLKPFGYLPKTILNSEIVDFNENHVRQVFDILFIKRDLK